MAKNLSITASIHPSFVAMFRAAPHGSIIFLNESASWCTSVAHQSGRKIRTQRSLALGWRSALATEVTRIEFLDEMSTSKKSSRHHLDPRQNLIPGMEVAR